MKFGYNELGYIQRTPDVTNKFDKFRAVRCNRELDYNYSAFIRKSKVNLC